SSKSTLSFAAMESKIRLRGCQKTRDEEFESLARHLRPPMTGPCLIHKEVCHGGRMYAREILWIGSTDAASGKGDRCAGRAPCEEPSYRAEGDLVRAGDWMSLERCAPGDGLLWRNRTHPAARVGKGGHLEPTAPPDVDYA